MRALTKSAVLAVAATVACTLPMGVAAAQTSPFGSLGSLGSSDPGPETPAPQVTVSKSADISAAGETITVTGSGFSGAGDGIYVGLVQDDKFSVTDAAAWMTTKWLRSTDIVGGSWSAAIDVEAVKAGSDCLVNACSIYTIAAHGSSDRSQDTQTPVSFGDDPDAPNADKAAAAALTADGGPTDGGTSAAANESNTSDSAIRNLADAISDGTAWIIPLLVGAVIGAGFAVATPVALRRRA